MKLKIAYYTRERIYSVEHQVSFLELHNVALNFAEPGFIIAAVVEVDIPEVIARGIPLRVPFQTVFPIKKE